ncbi:hypothetical protein KP509_33G000200 [Ceratopteris richardii]|uniref:Pentatricopeptide repeat-containing protein n=1 Tax=Ceratopteris richardii TaxID=49495 RepID=A0A8T2QMP2_CERRI|nr:hypothetical protein KP509_33G000200 [Ceratopteris richardii]
MSLYGGQVEYDRVFKLKEEMSSKNIQPDTCTCNILLNVLSKQGDLGRILTLAYRASGKEEKALELTDEKLSCSQEDRTLANDLMLTMCADHGKKSELKRFWSRVQSSNKVSVRTYGEAEDLASKAERKRGWLIVRVFNALLNVYASHGRMEAVEELMLRIMSEWLKPTAVTYRHLISGYLKMGELDKALEHLGTAREKMLNVELAENLFESYTSAGLFHSVKLYNTLLKVYLNSNSILKYFVQLMSDDGLPPNAETIVLLKQCSFK